MNEISHKGKIISIDPVETKVEIYRQSACEACHAKHLCGQGEGETKVISVATSGFDMHNVGDEVEVCLKRTMGLKAVWIGYAFPLLVLMAVLMACIFAGAGELASGLSAIAAVALYYLVVWCLRDRLRNEFVFYIK